MGNFFENFLAELVDKYAVLMGISLFSTMYSKL